MEGGGRAASTRRESGNFFCKRQTSSCHFSFPGLPHRRRLLAVYCTPSDCLANSPYSDIVNPDYELRILVNERNDSENSFLGMVLLLPAWVPNV
jgi:hypothetical protein